MAVKNLLVPCPKATTNDAGNEVRITCWETKHEENKQREQEYLKTHNNKGHRQALMMT
jgi:hypothetical protein